MASQASEKPLLSPARTESRFFRTLTAQALLMRFFHALKRPCSSQLPQKTRTFFIFGATQRLTPLHDGRDGWGSGKKRGRGKGTGLKIKGNGCHRDQDAARSAPKTPTIKAIEPISCLIEPQNS